MVTYTIALVASADAASTDVVPVAQEVLEAAGRRFGFGFRWKRLAMADLLQSDDLRRSDAVLLCDGSEMPDSVASAEWHPPVFGLAPAAPAAAIVACPIRLIEAGGQMLAHLGQRPAARAVELALAAVLADSPGSMNARQMGAAILTAL